MKLEKLSFGKLIKLLDGDFESLIMQQAVKENAFVATSFHTCKHGMGKTPEEAVINLIKKVKTNGN